MDHIASAALSEVEVTPEMVEAGVDCFYDLPEILGPSEEELRATLSRAFITMFKLLPRAAAAD